ncbi:hypothetical protein ACQV2W_07820 [Facklamia sp. P12934]|uniref:hypothetical protein n=1 Tax=Facklamia sp. P12934 TaxID=3421948 RepID=UPI003D16CD2C
MDSDIENRSAGSVTLTPDKYIHKYVWKSVKHDASGPRLPKYWHVLYQNGHRYEGWLVWTGEKRYIAWSPRYVQFQFHVNLMLTD